MRVCTLALALLTPLGPCWAGYGGLGPTDDEAAWVAEHVGMYAWGRKAEKELQDLPMEDKVRVASHLGTRVIRDELTLYPEPWRRTYDPTRLTYIDQLRTPGWEAQIDAFDVIVLTLGDASGRMSDPAWTRPHFAALTEYLLRAYADRGKTFILGNWEGDHWLKGREEQALPLFLARQQGIADGRAAVPNSRAKVYSMLEMVLLDYEGKAKLVNTTVPQTAFDLYSLSAWAYFDELTKALRYIDTKAPDSVAFGEHNCMIGEAAGGLGWQPDTLVVERSRRIMAEAREWGAPYVIWWELIGQDNGLMDTRYDGACKQAMYYWFFRAYHNTDDPLVVDDFEAEPWSPPGGDRSPDGDSTNCIGGKRDCAGSVGSCLVRGGRGGQRSLYLRFGSDGGEWTTGLMQLETNRFRAVRLALRGEADGLSLVLVGPDERRFAVPLVDYRRSDERDNWQVAEVPLEAFADLGAAELAALTIAAAGPGEVSLDDIAFVGSESGETRDRPAAARVPRASHIALRTGDQQLALSTTGAWRPTAAWLVPARGQRLVRPSLSDGAATVELADELLPGQELEVVPGGTSHLRFGPLRQHLDVTRPEAAGLTVRNLTGQERFHCLLPTEKSGPCWLQWRYASAFPVTHFRIVLYGSTSPGARARISVSADGETWAEAALDERVWDEGYWVARPPTGFAPTRGFWVRAELLPDITREDWQWSISASDLKVDLWIDTEDLVLPTLDGLRYSDNSATESPRGLLTLDW